MRTSRVLLSVVVSLAGLTACGANGDGDAQIDLSPTAEAGRDIVRSSGCASCHGRNGDGGPGPAFVGLYGSTVTFKDGTSAVADDDYLYEAITDPGARQVEGYGFPMPTNSLTDAQVEQVIAYIRELGTAGETAP